MVKYTDEEIRKFSKITCKIAADYLGISPMAVSIGMINDLLPIGFAIDSRVLYVDNKVIHIDYDKYCGRYGLSSYEKNRTRYT